jgi:formylglycine-generating enzyme required for sulfatase activity
MKCFKTMVRPFRKTQTLILLALLACPVIVHAAENRGIVPMPILDKNGRQVWLYKESHALVIGESEYTGGWKSLPGVKVDVGLVKAALEANGFEVHVKMNPSLRELEDTIKDFIDRFGRVPENRLLFYFAGHGHTLKLADGRDMGYFVPADAPDPIQDEAGFKRKAATMQIMEVYARQIEAKHALFMFDSCFSGAVLGLRRGGSRIPPLIESKTVKPVRQFITAGDENQQVPDESLFREFFVRALSGEGDLNRDGYVLGSELYLYMNDKITNYSGSSQTPLEGKIRDTRLDQGDFVFPLKTAGLQGGLVSLEEEKKRLENERIGVEKERKRTEAEKQVLEEKSKLEAEKRRLVEEQEKLARLEPQFSSAPAGMVRIPDGTFYAGLAGEGIKSFLEMNRFEKETRGMIGEMEIGMFYMDKYEVTQVEYERVMGINSSDFKGVNLPVDNVTWQEADAYCKRVGKRLPTEWEWEKAAKGGSYTIFPWGNKMQSGKANICDVNCELNWKANRFDDGHKHTARVGSYPPNGYGLYDMVGNVMEWTASNYGYSSGIKVLRGGSWGSGPGVTHPGFRNPGEPHIRYALGFRCVQ